MSWVGAPVCSTGGRNLNRLYLCLKCSSSQIQKLYIAITCRNANSERLGRDTTGEGCSVGCHLQQILDAGANVVLTTKGIDDMSLKYLVEANAIGCRRVPKEDLR